MLTRDFDFLKDKYREMLLPTLLMLLSDKICLIADVLVIGFFLSDSSFLSSIDLASPFIYFSAVIYTLFGVGGSLLALRASAEQHEEKANHYFTAAIFGVIIMSMLFVAFCLFIGNDMIVYFCDVPDDIFNTFLMYTNTLVFYFPFICYILTLGYFVRSDGYPNLPFHALLIANISNIAISFIMMGVFNMGVEGSALGTVIGYALGSLYISKYFFMENRDFYIKKDIKIGKSIKTFFEFISNTPEIISRIFLSVKVMFFTILCSEFLGIAGLMAFLVYDNSESLVYMFLSAIGKVMSPIVAVFYKEKDYEAVEYIVRKSIKHVLIISIPIALVFAVFPEFFVFFFTLDDPSEAVVICNALRITSLGLVGRCLSILLSNYTQAIENNKLASLMNISEEFIFAFAGGLILTSIYGANGIWYALVLADTVPLFIYLIAALLYRNKNSLKIRAILLLQETNTITWTYERGIDDVDHYLHCEKKTLALKLENMLINKSPVVMQSFDNVFENIMKDEEIQNIDVIVRYLDDTVTITLTYGGKLIDPITEEDIEQIGKVGGEMEYSPILGYNRAYFNVPV